ncbi:MAG: T9SS type A sorting domain-containing protein [Saprospiraceae bacterium]
MTWYFSSLPHFPDYSLWAKDRVDRGLAPIIDTAVCDSTILPYVYETYTTSTKEPVKAKTKERLLWPNPARAHQNVQIGLSPSELLDVSRVVHLYDVQGRIVSVFQADAVGEVLQFKVPDLAAGLYKVTVLDREMREVRYTASLVLR